MIRVLLADDQVLFVESLKTVLEMRSRDIRVTGIARDGREAVAMAEQQKPDIVLLDVRMPVMDGVEAARIIRERLPEVQVAMLTTFDDDVYVLEALRHGAVGYLLKSTSPADLISAVRSIKNGSVLISPEVASRLVEQLARQKQRSEEAQQAGAAVQQWQKLLSPREREVLSLLAEGRNNHEIAEALSLAEQTVKNHVSVIYSKLGVHDRARVVRLATGGHRSEAGEG